MMGAVIFPWMGGVWDKTLAVPPTVFDTNGTAITVGATVKLVGIVTVVDSNNTHFGAVTLKVVHPNGNGPLVGKTFVVDPSTLVVGS